MQHIGSAAPIFRVQDVRAGLEYYVNALGFSVDWDDEGIVSVSRDGCTVFLCSWDQGQPGSWAWAGVQDCASLHDELVKRGARIRQPPTNFPWALEMQVEDLDGNVLRLGSGPRDDVPFGRFLDAGGVLWDTVPDPES